MNPMPVRVGISIPPAGFASHDDAITYVHTATEAGLDHLSPPTMWRSTAAGAGTAS